MHRDNSLLTLASNLTLRASAVLGPRAVTVPPTGWNGGDAVDLSTWLYLAAGAQEAPSSAMSLRLYYLIFEDPRFAALEATPRFRAQLKALRDFVSHPIINSSTTQQTLQSLAPALFAEPTAFRFLPSNRAQQTLLDEWRLKARAIVDSELQRLLGLAAAG